MRQLDVEGNSGCVLLEAHRTGLQFGLSVSDGDMLPVKGVLESLSCSRALFALRVCDSSSPSVTILYECLSLSRSQL